MSTNRFSSYAQASEGQVTSLQRRAGSVWGAVKFEPKFNTPSRTVRTFVAKKAIFW